MRIIGILLLVLISMFYGMVLLVLLRPPFDLHAFIGVSAFFIFLFLLTLVLREHTKSRLVMGREVSPRILGIFIASLGLGLCYMSSQLAAGLPLSSGRRGKLIALIVDIVGAWPSAVVFAAFGLQMLLFGYHTFRSDRT